MSSKLNGNLTVTGNSKLEGNLSVTGTSSFLSTIKIYKNEETMITLNNITETGDSSIDVAKTYSATITEELDADFLSSSSICYEIMNSDGASKTGKILFDTVVAGTTQTFTLTPTTTTTPIVFDTSATYTFKPTTDVTTGLSLRVGAESTARIFTDGLGTLFLQPGGTKATDGTTTEETISFGSSDPNYALNLVHKGEGVYEWIIGGGHSALYTWESSTT